MSTHQFHTTTDVVNLVKQDGRRIEGIKAGIHSTSIIIPGGEWPIEEGDALERLRGSGIVDRYIVTDPNFRDSSQLGPHFQVKYRKPSATEQPSTVVYNLHGVNSRVNNNSTDNSVNVVRYGSEDTFDHIREAIKQLNVSDESERTELLAKVTDLESAKDTPQYTTLYRDFVGTIADHYSLLAPLAAALAYWLK